MAILILAAILVSIAAPAFQLPGNNVAVYPASQNLRERAELLERNHDNLEDFVEEKLVQHSQALEQLLRMSQTQAEELKRLVDNVSKDLSKTKLPDKTEVQKQTRRSGSLNTEKPRTLVNKIPVYGTLLRNFVVNEYSNDAEPHIVVEESYVPGQTEQGRSGNGNGNVQIGQP